MSKKISDFTLVAFLAADDYVTAIDVDQVDPELQNVICEVQNAGLEGPAGADGDIVTLTANGALGGQRVVIGDGLGGASYADSSNTAHRGKVIGITTAAAIDTAPVTIRVAGEMEELAWSWSIGEVYFNSSGVLTQTPPASGFVQVVGTAIAPTKIAVNVQVPILLI